MHVKNGQTVALRDGTAVYVTDATPQHKTEVFDWEGEGGTIVEHPAENIFRGYLVHPELLMDPNCGEEGYEPFYVVSDMSEVVGIIEE